MAQQKVKGQRKFSRGKRKAAGKLTPLSLFVRGKIQATDYFRLTNQAIKA